MKNLERIEVLSRWEVGSFMEGLDADWALISITDPESPFAAVPPSDRCRGVLRLRFHDIETDSGPGRPFTPEQAGEVRRFLDRTDARVLVCQCDYGISRSAGMAAAAAYVHRLDAGRFFTGGGYDPNMLVFDRLLRAYQVEDPGRVAERFRTPMG
jgi:predicted protein tyrosine phosphatase